MKFHSKIVTDRFPRSLDMEPKNCFPWNLKSLFKYVDILRRVFLACAVCKECSKGTLQFFKMVSTLTSPELLRCNAQTIKVKGNMTFTEQNRIFLDDERTNQLRTRTAMRDDKDSFSFKNYTADDPGGELADD